MSIISLILETDLCSVFLKTEVLLQDVSIPIKYAPTFSANSISFLLSPTINISFGAIEYPHLAHIDPEIMLYFSFPPFKV